MKILSVVLWLVMGSLAVMTIIANRRAVVAWLRAQHREWMTLPRRTRRGVSILCLVMFGYMAVVTGLQDASARRSLDQMGDTQAYWSGLQGGMSVEGAQAYGRYVREVKEIFDHYRTLVAIGEIDEVPSVREMSPEEYIVRHPEYVRTSEEEARWHPRFRAQVTGEPLLAE